MATTDIIVTLFGEDNEIGPVVRLSKGCRRV
jgi:hypothetical protein